MVPTSTMKLLANEIRSCQSGIAILKRAWQDKSTWLAEVQAGFPPAPNPIWSGKGASEEAAIMAALSAAHHYWTGSWQNRPD